MNQLLIGEVAQQAGVAPSTIRYYEKIGLLPEAQRINGRRHYESTILERLRMIRIAQSLGWSLTDIKESFTTSDNLAGLAAFWKGRLPAKIAELDRMIAELSSIKAKLESGADCDCQVLDECVLFSV